MRIPTICLSLVLGLLSPAISVAGIFGPSTYEDCLLEGMKGVTQSNAAFWVEKACRSKFPEEPVDHAARQKAIDDYFGPKNPEVKYATDEEVYGKLLSEEALEKIELKCQVSDSGKRVRLDFLNLTGASVNSVVFILVHNQGSGYEYPMNERLPEGKRISVWVDIKTVPAEEISGAGCFMKSARQ